MRLENKYLKKIGKTWYYTRRIPKRYMFVDERINSRLTLRTSSIVVARELRDELVHADELYWSSLALARLDPDYQAPRNLIERRYSHHRAIIVEKARVRSVMSTHKQLEHIDALTTRLEYIVHNRVVSDEISFQYDERQKVGALTIKNALKKYLGEMSFNQTYSKSSAQRKKWIISKTTQADKFIRVCGNKRLGDVKRGHALRYRDWWSRQIELGKSPNTANRYIGSMRDLYTRCYEHYGINDQPNPFTKLHFTDRRNAKRPRFTDQWIKDKLLVPNVLGGEGPELILALYAVIETGCRISEISNLQSQDIILEHPYPHILVREKRKMTLKTKSSNRVIPLVGIAREAMCRAPKGFPAYFDRGGALSAKLLRALRKRGLCPTKDHVIHSLRHSFEDRMLEAEIDFELRRRLMGHNPLRAEYGEGGSLKFRTQQLQKIAFSFDPAVALSLSKMNYS